VLKVRFDSVSVEKKSVVYSRNAWKYCCYLGVCDCPDRCVARRYDAMRNLPCFCVYGPEP
jgi:hypothetical protein